MILSALIATLGVILFPLAMVYAGFMDLVTMKIRNGLVLGLVASWFVLAPLAGFGLSELGWSIGVAGLVFAVTFAFFALGWIGGGDAKLAAATALWLGFDHLLGYVLYASMLGGALTLLILQARTLPLPAMLTGREWAERLHKANGGIPYGVALAAAALMIYPETPWMRALG